MCIVLNVSRPKLFALAINLAVLQACLCARNRETTRPVHTDLKLPGNNDPDFITFQENVDMQHNYHHHHHNHNHQHYHPDEKTTLRNDPTVPDKIIPINFIREFNNFDNISDLLLNFVEGDYESEPYVGNRFGEEERNAAVMPKSAACIPELQTVKIAPTSDPSMLYIPSCTRIERCGGCCSHSLLSCQAKDTETVSFQLIKTQFTGGSKLKYAGKEIVLVEKHTKCKCDCKVQEKDCNTFQVYRKSECRCVCTNSDEEKKCYKNNSTKLWNPEICACQCREELQCTTGYIFDPNNCKCILTPIRRRYAENLDQERTGYKSEASPVLPLHDLEDSDN